MIQKLKEPDAEALDASETLYSKMINVFKNRGTNGDRAKADR